MLVVDASVLVVVVADDGPDGDTARARMMGEHLTAPDVIDLEVLSTLRRLHAAGVLDDRRARYAVDDLLAIPIDRAHHLPLLERCWELRANFTAYDAVYVALAEVVGVPLLTADQRLARSPLPRCEVEVLTAPTG